ncbi:MAG: ATP-binding protein [Cyanobacteriota bacterium]|nr:ATP-binding protein [Cyanobacteriota bacterium]
MAKPAPSSFRRILLSRLLLLSVPILLGMGVTFIVTYRKARSALLETARQNLTESAVRKAESIAQEIAALKTNLATASESSILVDGRSEQYQTFVRYLSKQLPTEVQCVQLLEAETQDAIATTCDRKAIENSDVKTWPENEQQLLLDSSEVRARVIKSDLPASSPPDSENFLAAPSRLNLELEAPVYDSAGSLRYILLANTILVQQDRATPGSLAGYSVALDEGGTILMHPSSDRVGRNIAEENDAERLQSILKNAILGRQDFLHFGLGKDGEAVAGYTAIPSPIDPASGQQWAVLAVTRLDNALADLWDIQRVLWLLLFFLTLALIAANLLAIAYIARELARPVEKLRDFALDPDNCYSHKMPQNLNIREFNELASALNKMVQHLQAWAMEVETAWKEAQTANQLKSEFLTTISHELRTPLNGIIGSIRLIEDGFCDDREEEMEFLQQADRAAVHLLGIIDDILNISKIEAGQLSLTLEPVNFSQSLAEAVALSRPTIESKGLKLIFSPIKEDYWVEADPDKLKQIFYNILDNATKFTKEGSILVSLSVEPMSPTAIEETAQKFPHLKSGKQAIATVQDTGIGIASEQMDKLFRPFVMIDGSTTREAGGTGLGLALARNFIELMGGTVTLTSAGKGQGTSASIALPLAETASEEPVPTPSPGNVAE